MANATIWDEREIQFAELIPQDVVAVSDGTSREWTRKRPTYAKDPEEQKFYMAHLDWRGVRQSLPRGSSPLMAFGGRAINGQDFNKFEVENFIKTYGLNRDYVCVFEYTRPIED